MRVSVEYGALKNGGHGGDRGQAGKNKTRYENAKNNRDAVAALEVVDTFLTDEWYTLLIDDLEHELKNDSRIIAVFPMPGFASSDISPDVKPITNALPAAVSKRLSEVIGCDVNEDIFQIARPGRTKLKRMQRFMFQPKFDGVVDASATYLLIDDVYTLGGTFASLRSHIVEGGAKVVAAGVLASSLGKDRPFKLEKSTIEGICSMYSEEIRTFWIEEIGHEISCLTEPEGRFLLDWGGDVGQPTLQRLREKFDKIRSSFDQ